MVLDVKPGGGGSGAASDPYTFSTTATAGGGGQGTSYSGGTGGGAAAANSPASNYPRAENGYNNGEKGGDGKRLGYYPAYVGGGAGNPGGNGTVYRK